MRTKKHHKGLRKAFGLHEDYDIINLPPKISGTQISRIFYGDRLGCSHCFPHGWEVANAKFYKYQRNWKRYRKTQWKT